MRRLPLTAAALLLALAACVPAAAQAQESPPDPSEIGHRPGVWAGAFYGGLLNVGGPEKTGLHLWFDLHLRQRPPVSDGGVGSFLAIVRPGIGYRFLPWLTLDVGYAFLPVVSAAGPVLGAEHRAWTHLVVAKKLGPVALQFRPRFEVRFSGSSDTPGARLRTFGRVNVDIAGPVYLPIWDEAFWQLNRFGSLEAGLDENRAFVGVGVKPVPWLGLELGYMNRWLPARNTGGTPQMQHTALLVASVSPPPGKPRPAQP